VTKNNNIDNWNQEIGSRVLAHPKKYCGSQRQKAEKVGLRINTYRKNEMGINYPSVLIIDRLRNRLGVSLDLILVPGKAY
jgi:transcriptional regulator with XRE-family HTH domain